MTKKDYIEIAGVLGSQFVIGAREQRLTVWASTLSLADKFAQGNPRFNRETFYRAVFGTSDPYIARDIALDTLPTAVSPRRGEQFARVS